jgi:serine/threonine protein kinase
MRDSSERGGALFGRYRLIEPLGSGGMAVVYRAVIDGPEGFARSLVIKRILPEFAKDPHFMGMLASEARLVARLQHPGIVPVYELGEVEGEYFLAMELVDGYDLASVLSRCVLLDVSFPPALVARVISALAEALGYAHALCDADGRPLAIVHRDVSPSNVMLAKVGSVKLLDFGIAQAAAHLRDERTRTGVVKGKLAYLSPEQADGHPADRRSDIFALGIIFYEMLTRQRLFRGVTDLATLRLVREARVEPPSVRVSGLDPRLDAVVMKMLAVSPELRFQSCEEVIAALKETVQRADASEAGLRAFLTTLEPIKLAPSAESQTVGDQPLTATGPVLFTASGIEGRRTSPLRRWLVAVLGLLLLAGVSVGLALGGATPNPSPPPAPPVELPLATEPVAQLPSVPAMVSVTVRGTAGAIVALNGAKVGVVPLTLELPSEAGTRRFSVSLAGHQSIDRELPADRDVAFEANLGRKPTRGSSNKRQEVSDPFRPR